MRFHTPKGCGCPSCNPCNECESDCEENGCWKPRTNSETKTTSTPFSSAQTIFAVANYVGFSSACPDAVLERAHVEVEWTAEFTIPEGWQAYVYDPMEPAYGTTPLVSVGMSANAYNKTGDGVSEATSGSASCDVDVQPGETDQSKGLDVFVTNAFKIHPVGNPFMIRFCPCVLWATWTITATCSDDEAP